MLVTMRPWMPRRRLALATKCTICRSFTCDREAATIAKTASDKAFTAAVLGRTDRTGLYPALKAADLRADTAWRLCIATGRENDRQMGIFIAAMITTQAQRFAFDRAISEGVRQSMQPKQCGATMLCMRGAR